MRIISGTARGRKLLAPPACPAGRELIRPTADRARESIFNIIGRKIRAARVLDLFAGTGAMGVEALSRGASVAVFVDWHRQALDLIEKNVGRCGFSEKSQVIKRDLTKGLFFLAGGSGGGNVYDLVFLDPPYRQDLVDLLLDELCRWALLSPEAMVVVEDDANCKHPERALCLQLTDQRRYGSTGFWLYQLSPGGVDRFGGAGIDKQSISPSDD